MYQVKKFRFFLASFISTIFACLLILLGIFLWNYQVEQYEKNLIARSKQLIDIMGSFATERWKQERRAIVSNLMNQLVKNLEKTSPNLKVRESFFLSKKGKVLAHSNPISISKGMRNSYRQSEYYQVYLKSKQNGVIAKTLSYQKTGAFPLLEEVANLYPPLGLLLEHLLSEKISFAYYHGLVSYVPFSSRPVGSLHLITEFQFPPHLFSPLTFYQKEYFYTAAFLGLLIFCFVFVGQAKPSYYAEQSLIDQTNEGNLAPNQSKQATPHQGYSTQAPGQYFHRSTEYNPNQYQEYMSEAIPLYPDEEQNEGHNGEQGGVPPYPYPPTSYRQ